MPDPPSAIKLADLIDVRVFQSMMDDFYQVARVPMSIVDVDGNILVGVGWQDICTQFHRVNADTCRHCIESDTQLTVGLRPGEVRLYKCKNNMWDVATPILVDGQRVGNVFSGQFFFDDETPDYPLFEAQARTYGFDGKDYLLALDRVPRLSRTVVDRAMSFFVKLAQTVSGLGEANLRLRATIEERERLQLQLQENINRLNEANRLKDEFLSTLSHELRTPLNAILGWSQMLLGGRIDEAATQKALEVIERNARLQALVVNDILDVSNLISGKLRLDVRELDVAECVKGALESTRPAAVAKHIAIAERIEKTPRIAGDRDRLQQVMWNLLSNAVKFTPEYGRIRVSVHPTGSQVEILVEDSGIGIAPEFVPHVFERFRQADGSMSRHHGGLGLGLAIVRHLVEMHGGVVRASSAGEGQGATFTVTLPAIVPAASPG